MGYILVSFMLFAQIGLPAPDSFIYPRLIDTLSDLELVIFPPKGASYPLYYKIDWGDGETLNWTGPIRQPIDISRYHRYRSTGNFNIKIMAMDSLGEISPWSLPCSVQVVSSLVKWFVPTPEPVVASPALDLNGNIYVGDEGGTFYSLSPDGKLRWTFATNGPIYAGATVEGGFVYLPSLDSHLYCLDTLGNLIWSVKLPDELWSSVTIGPDGILYIGTDSGFLFAIDQRGKILFHHKLGEEISSAPTIVDSYVYVSADSLYCFTKKGKRIWTFGTPDGSYFFASPVPDGNGNVYIGNFDGYLYCIASNGRMRWRAPSPDLDEIRTEVTFSPDGTLFFGTDGYYLCAKPPAGSIKVVYETNDIICATPAVSDNGTVYLLSDDGTFYAFTPNWRLLFTLPVATEGKELYYTSSPTIGPDGTVYVGSWEGGLYAILGDAPPAKTLWSQFRHNAQHTGRITSKRRR